MNAAEQLEAARRLQAGLAHAGLVIESADVVDGNVRTWNPVAAVRVLGLILQAGWRVRDAITEPALDARPPRPLSIVRDDSEDDGA